MLKAWLPPCATCTVPDGLMPPFAPADAVIVYAMGAKLAEIVCVAVTLEKVYVLTAPAEAPSTITPAIPKPAAGAIAKLLLAPRLKITVPLGLIEPLAPEEAVRVKHSSSFEKSL